MVNAPRNPTAKVPKTGGISLEEAIAKSNAALESVIEEHKPDVKGQWDEICEFHVAYQASKDADDLDKVFKAVHKLRGDAVTLGYPLVARIGSCFCRSLLEKEEETEPHPGLIAEHINAMTAAFNEGDENAGGATGEQVVVALEQAVSKLISK